MIRPMITPAAREQLGRLHRCPPGTCKGRAVARLNGYCEVPDNFSGRSRLVERIEMEAGRSLAQELLALSGRVLDAELGDGLIVIAVPLQLRDQRTRQGRSTQRNEPFDLRSAENRQNTRHDWHRDAPF